MTREIQLTKCLRTPPMRVSKFGGRERRKNRQSVLERVSFSANQGMRLGKIVECSKRARRVVCKREKKFGIDIIGQES